MIFFQVHLQLLQNGLVGTANKRGKNARGTRSNRPGNLLTHVQGLLQLSTVQFLWDLLHLYNKTFLK